MLTHLVICIDNLFPRISRTIHLKQYFAYNTHGPFSVQSSKPGLFLTVPKRAVGCPWAALSLSIGSILWNQNPWPFPAQQHPNHNLAYNYNTRGPFSAQDQSGTVQNRFQKFQQFNPKFWDRPNNHLWPQINQTIYKALKTENNRVGEGPYLSELSKIHKTGAQA